MLTMLVRNRVQDYSKWRSFFDSQELEAREAGLILTDLWRDVDDPQQIFFLLSVGNLEKAKDFLANPRSAKVGEAAGVLDGEVHFLERDEAAYADYK